MSSKYIARLEKRIKEIISEHIIHHLNDPRIGFVTITGVKLLEDLSRATVLFSVLGPHGEKTKTTHALQHAAGSLRRVLGKALRTKIIPKLVFEYDDTVEKRMKMEELIREARASDSDGGLDSTGAGEEESANQDVSLPTKYQPLTGTHQRMDEIADFISKAAEHKKEEKDPDKDKTEKN